MNSISTIAIAKLEPPGPAARAVLSEVVQALVLTKENLWEFLKSEAVMDRAVEIMGELEPLQMLELFFDRAIYHAAVGHEQEMARAPREAGVLRGG